ncbi:MAG: hypothetical protein ACTHJN_05005 [Ginsengibacter sp.]
MQKLSLFAVVCCFFILNACHSTETVKPPDATIDSTNIFPVTSFLRAQLKELDTLPITPLYVVSQNGKKDSTWLKREDIRKYATPFLSPKIDSANMQNLFQESSFLDQSINSYTFSYDPKSKLPDSIHLNHWDVYMNPQNNLVTRIYLVKEEDSAGENVTRQLTWLVDKWFSIRTISQKQGQKPEIKEEKMIWNFD